MKRLFWITLTLAALTIQGCKPTINGTYVVYNVSDIKPNDSNNFDGINGSTNDTIYNYLKRTVLGTKYQITFNDKYVTMINNRKEEMVLTKAKDYYNLDVFQQDITVDNKDYSFRLKIKKDGTIVYGIRLTMKDGAPFKSAQVGGLIINTSGTVICLLNKTD